MSQQIYGLIGNPVSHSLSPLMHNAAFKYLNIPAEYKLFPLKEERVEDFLKNLSANNISGINVTVPYKEKVIPYLDDINPVAKLIGAVNTIRVEDGHLKGFNTDGEGFLRHLQQEGFIPKGKNIAIIGAGGAAKAVIYLLLLYIPKSLKFYDLDKSKASSLVVYLKEYFEAKQKYTEINFVDSISDLNIDKCDLLVNTTPVGMKETDPCLVDVSFLHRDMFVYDLIYNPAETKLLKTAKAAGAKTANGLGMLLYQGALAFEKWFPDKKAPIEVMRQALEEGLKK